MSTAPEEELSYEEKYDDHIGVDCPSELKRKARMAAVLEDKSLSQWVRDTLEDATQDVDLDQ
ncbi:hypothetical protein [Haloarcula sp. CGMCC 1.6347]|uniref:hypothetical protein n=1 Tax=Haloarcula sp. CGMCC 1.6347 TaxID=3111455 RepID=UPI00300F662B